MRGNASAAKVVTALFAFAIFIAPFIAVLYSIEAGLVVMAVALLATVSLVRAALGIAPASTRRWLRVAAAVNAILALACIVAIVWLTLRR